MNVKQKLIDEVKKVVNDPSSWNKDRYDITLDIRKKQEYALPSDDDGYVAELTFEAMYESDLDDRYLNFDTLELIAEIFGSRKINLDNEISQESAGCHSCGYGGSHTRKLFIFKKEGWPE